MNKYYFGNTSNTCSAEVNKASKIPRPARVYIICIYIYIKYIKKASKNKFKKIKIYKISYSFSNNF